MLSSTVRLPLRLSKQPPATSQLCRFSTSRMLRETVVAIEATTTPASQPNTQPLPYFVHRTSTKNLPVYEENKRGGNYLQTRVRKVEGNAAALREQLLVHLGIPEDMIYINNLTKHVIVKGHYKSKVEQFLTMQKF